MTYNLITLTNIFMLCTSLLIQISIKNTQKLVTLLLIYIYFAITLFYLQELFFTFIIITIFCGGISLLLFITILTLETNVMKIYPITKKKLKFWKYKIIINVLFFLTIEDKISSNNLEYLIKNNYYDLNLIYTELYIYEFNSVLLLGFFFLIVTAILPKLLI